MLSSEIMLKFLVVFTGYLTYSSIIWGEGRKKLSSLIFFFLLSIISASNTDQLGKCIGAIYKCSVWNVQFSLASFSQTSVFFFFCCTVLKNEAQQIFILISLEFYVLINVNNNYSLQTSLTNGNFFPFLSVCVSVCVSVSLMLESFFFFIFYHYY